MAPEIARMFRDLGEDNRYAFHVMHGPVAAGTVAGSGLGLTVCKGLVEAHGGKIWAESRLGGGLIVTVTLPCNELERIDE